MGHRHITVGAIIDAARWVKDAYRVVKHNPPGSPARRVKLDQLALAASHARQSADASQNKVMGTVLRVAELGIEYAGIPNRTKGRHVKRPPAAPQGPQGTNR